MPALAALEALLAEPAQAERWHRLFALLAQQPGLRQEVLSRVDSELPRHDTAGVLRASFLLMWTQELGYLAQMREALNPGSACFLEEAALFEFLAQTAVLTQSSGHDAARARYQAWQLPSLLLQAARRIEAAHDCPAPAGAVPACVRRLLIVAPQLGRLANPPTRLVYDHLQLARSLGLEVQVLAAGRLAEPARYCGAPLQHPFDDEDAGEWTAALASREHLWVGDRQLPLQLRWLQLLQRAQSLVPDAVLFVGLGSPFLHLAHGRFPLVVLPTSGLPPLGPADVWLCSAPPPAAEHPGPPLAQDYAFRVRAKASVDAAAQAIALRRGAFGPAASSPLTLVTAGLRLHEEINGAWAESMSALMLDLPQLRWCIVGAPRCPRALEALGDRVVLRPYTSDLNLALADGDIYLNPPRLGGGFSVAEAMACGLPAVAYARTDGGDKLGPWASPDDGHYFLQLRALIASAELRDSTGQAMRRRFHEALDLAHAGPSFAAALQRAVDSFSRRRSAAVAS